MSSAEFLSAHSFWTELLPQIGLVQPAVKHMLLATSSVVEFAALDGIPLDQNPGYQLHYTKAIQATCASPQVENVLMACLLFACCDFMRGSVVSGLRHIHAGLNIIDEWCKTSKDPDSKTSPTARLIVGAIGPIFVSYFDKAPTYGMGDVTLARSAYCAPITPVVELPYIGVFTHLHRVHHALDGIAHHIARMMDWRTKPWIPSPPAEIQSLLDSWRVSFDDFKANLSESRKELYARSLQILQIHSTALSVMLRASSGDTESIYEQFEEEFMWIVDKYDDFAAMWAQDESAKFFAGCANNLDCHMGFIPPLFLTATKCRNPATRMAALNHLAALEVEENNWTSCTAYVIARKIIEVETRRSIINNRVGMRDEQDLIRPVKAFLTDKRTTQGGLDYAEFPYEGESTPVLCETLDLMDCSSLGSNCSSGQWVCSGLCSTFERTVLTDREPATEPHPPNWRLPRGSREADSCEVLLLFSLAQRGTCSFAQGMKCRRLGDHFQSITMTIPRARRGTEEGVDGTLRCSRPGHASRVHMSSNCHPRAAKARQSKPEAALVPCPELRCPANSPNSEAPLSRPLRDEGITASLSRSPRPLLPT